jgi:hypothetical protein
MLAIALGMKLVRLFMAVRPLRHVVVSFDWQRRNRHLTIIKDYAVPKIV